MYAKDPRYVPDEDRPGSFRIALDTDRRKRRRAVPLTDVEQAQRLPVLHGSNRSRKSRRRAKQRRRS